MIKFGSIISMTIMLFLISFITDASNENRADVFNKMKSLVDVWKKEGELDATNLLSLEDSHQHSLGFDLSDIPRKVHRKEMYMSRSGEELSELVLVRSEQ